MTSLRQSDETREFGVFRGDKLYENIQPKEPIIEGILDVGDNLIISSKAGSGKSILAIQLICNLTTGTDFLDTFSIHKPRRVLYVQTEGSRAETIARMKRMQKSLKIDNDMWVHYNAVGIPLNTQQGLDKFLSQITSLGMNFDVIIIDPLYPTLKGSISADDVATDWQRGSRVIRESFPGVAYIIFHHDTSKEMWVNGVRVDKPVDDAGIGSSMWTAWASANYKLTVRSDSIRVLTAGKGEGKGRTGQGVSEIQMRLVEPSPLYYQLDDTHLGETERIIWELVDSNPFKRYRRIELEKLCTKSKATVCRVLHNFVKAGRIAKTEEEGIIYYAKSR